MLLIPNKQFMNIANTNAVAKIAALVAGLGLVAMSFAAFATPASAATQAEIQAQIAALQAQLNAQSAGTTFTSDMTIGSQGTQVVALQTWLINKGFAIPAGATGYFGAQTQAALAKYQASVGISPAVGYFGPVTRSFVNATVVTPGPGSSNGGGFDGDEEGSLEDFDQISKFSDEEVGEDEEDVTVLGVEFEADGADQKVDRVDVVIETPASNDDLDEFITEVGIAVDGDVVARMDVEDADEDDGIYEFRFTGLDAIVEEGDRAELEVVVTGVNNIDSADAGLDLTVTIPEDGIRASSPNGVTDTYDSGDFSTTFSVDTFAAANGIDVKVSLGDDSPEAGTVDVDADDETNDVALLEFEIKVKGSDVTLDELTVDLESAFADIENITSSLTLELDGEEFTESVNIAGTTGAVVFEDLDVTVEDGDTIVGKVFADINDLGSFSEGDTLKASVSASNIEAEDETGEEVASGDLNGTANGEEQAFYDNGLEVTLVDSESDTNGDGDIGTFTITYRIAAGDEDVFVAKTASTTLSGGNSPTNWSIFADFDEVSGSVDEVAPGVVKISDGSVAEFTLTATKSVGAPANNDFYSVEIAEIEWGNTQALGNVYNFDLNDFDAGPEYIAAN